MKNYLSFASIGLGSLLSFGAVAADVPEVAAARGVIARYAGEAVAASLQLELIPSVAGYPVYEIADEGRTIRGSSPVAIAKGFYANVRAKGAGIVSWSGNRFDAAKAFAPAAGAVSGAVVRVVSPYRHHQYLNVVTYGYTMCYWDEARWMREFDWMALHGYDMPLLVMGAEAVGDEVWKKLGLTQDEIENYFPGPIYLPWFLMGNLSERPDKQDAVWRARTVRLQRKLLARARELGMTPIAPGFGGFVPKALARVKPEAKLLEMSWSGNGKHPPFHNHLLSPDQPLFREVARLWYETYQNLFGKVDFYLADSFNEMKLPWPDEAATRAALEQCGENIYGGMTDINPDATWVMQGWMFFWSAEDWSVERIASLTRAVPDDRMLILDMAADYIRYGKNAKLGAEAPATGALSCWDRYDGFCGKGWLWGTIPNMGGDVDLTGPVEYYANAHLQALSSRNRRNLRAFGIAPEGIESNELIFELASEAGWRDTFTDVRAWLRGYARSRYGAAPEAMEELWDALLPITYNEFRDHPFFTWQYASRMCGWGRENNPHSARERDLWRRAVTALDRCDAELATSPLWRADAAEYRMIALANEAEQDFLEEEALHKAGKADAAAAKRARIRATLTRMDALLKDHPLHRLDRWIAFARGAAEGDTARADCYERDARRIISLWGPPVEDYSARLWNGVIVSYCLPKLEIWWAHRDEGQDAAHDLVAAFELEWSQQVKGQNRE